MHRVKKKSVPPPDPEPKHGVLEMTDGVVTIKELIQASADDRLPLKVRMQHDRSGPECTGVPFVREYLP